MVRTSEELMGSIRDYIGENHDDAAITLLEDMTDTLGDYNRRIQESGDWESKYRENDAQWRKRYSDRFYGNPVEDDVQIKEEVTTKNIDDTETVELAQTVSDLFTEKGES